jgi:hypothetical protein
LYCLSFFFWSLYCLSFFDLRLLINPFGIFKLFLTKYHKIYYHSDGQQIRFYK